MTALLAALIALTTAYTTVIETDDLHPAVPTAIGWRVCGADRVTTITIRNIAKYTAWREYAEAWERVGALDCRDDGVFNGSPVPGCDVAAFVKARPDIAEPYGKALRDYDAEWGTRVTADLLRAECASWHIMTFGLAKEED